ncbi:MAG: DNA repair protein RecO [Anaerolineae bacterium]
MAKERLYRTEGLVLRRTDFGEADRLLTVFTPDLGKLRLIAKGARKTKSRKAGHIELFTHTALLVAKGRNLDIISQAESLESFRPLREDLGRISYAYYVVELLDRFIEEGDENFPLFELALRTVARLSDEAAENLFLALRYFELHLLGLTGFQPQLHFCVACGNPLQPVTNYFQVADGGVLCPKDGEARAHAEPLLVATLKVLRFLQTEAWPRVKGLQLTPATGEKVEKTLQRYITYLLERKLKSTDFLKHLQEQERRS